MGSQMPKSSRTGTSGRLAKNLTWWAYAVGPLRAAELEMRICSNRNAPTGTIPLSECSRRSKKLIPLPARSGATPAFTSSGLLTLPASPIAGMLVATENLLRLLQRRRQLKNAEPSIIFLRGGEVKASTEFSDSAKRIPQKQPRGRGRPRLHERRDSYFSVPDLSRRRSAPV